MNISIACDHGAIREKDALIQHLQESGHIILDRGVNSPSSVDYPDCALPALQDLAQNKAELVVLLCGTGIGMCMSANKFSGTRAALLSDPYSARMAKEHNNANVICFGARVLGFELIRECIDSFLSASFKAGRHQRRIDKVMQIETNQQTSKA